MSNILDLRTKRITNLVPDNNTYLQSLMDTINQLNIEKLMVKNNDDTLEIISGKKGQINIFEKYEIKELSKIE